MKSTVSQLLLISCLSIGVAGTAHSATVTFSDILDGNGNSTLFDPATTMPDAGDGNILNIGLDNFVADNASAVDTLSMVITAPDGYVINSIAYTESGDGMTTNGVANASGSIVADGMPTNFPSQMFNPNSSGGWSITPTPTAIDGKQSIAVSITNSLFAYAFGPDDEARIGKTEASLTVGITPVPVPAAAWLFGSALLGLAGIQRRKAKA